MPLFPDEFPFNKPVTPPAAPAKQPAPVVPATIAPAPVSPTPIAPAPVAPAPAAPPPVVRVQTAAPAPVLTNSAIPAQLPEGEERRRSPRQALVARAMVRNETTPGPSWKVELLNISMLGIRFLSNTRLQPGDKASIKLECGPLRWSTKLRVIHCHKAQAGRHAMVCEFAPTDFPRPARRAA